VDVRKMLRSIETPNVTNGQEGSIDSQRLGPV
jgi:hypothetical protein